MKKINLSHRERFLVENIAIKNDREAIMQWLDITEGFMVNKIWEEEWYFFDKEHKIINSFCKHYYDFYEFEKFDSLEQFLNAPCR